VSWEVPTETMQCRVGDLVRSEGTRWRVTREGYETRDFDDYDQADAHFRGDQHLLVKRTIQAID
jgi:hypothetical protein